MDDESRLDAAPEPLAVALTTVAPTSGTGIGPHTLTLTGTGFSTTPNACRIILKDAGGATVGESGLVTATSTTSVTAAVTCGIFTASGTYTVWLITSGIGTAGPAFTLTRVAPTVPGTLPPDFGAWYRDARFPANRPGRR